MSSPLLEIASFSVMYGTPDGAEVPLLSDISLQLRPGEALGVVGESGSGKSLLALGIMGLLPAGMRTGGSIRFGGGELLSLAENELCMIRGPRIGMIFQEPMSALNPVMTVGDQIAEGIVWHRKTSWSTARRDARRLLDQVRIPNAAARSGNYPHELSGGERQRVGIAIALALKPELLIADEPTTALDVSVQNEVLDILDEHVRSDRLSMILVSHDLGVIARSCNRTVVLYAGARMEEGSTNDVLKHPRNPYTRGLLSALPRRRAGRQRLMAIPGSVPGPAGLPAGCRFSDRCPDMMAACLAKEPAWERLSVGRGIRCIRHGNAGALE